MFIKLSEGVYGYKGKNNPYMMQFGNIGVLSYGKCWRLYKGSGSDKELLAVFVTVDDGNRCYNMSRCEGHKIWSEDAAFNAAEKIIQNYENFF